MVEHHSYKIQNVIQKELFNAKSSIKIVVAWFTNDLLFQPLVLKQKAGVNVEIILNKDEINCSEDNSIDFDELVNVGGSVRWNDTKQLLHDKFCIIDGRIVISGSYNWTNKAEYNEENVSVFKDESETIAFFEKKYTDLAKKIGISKKIIQKPQRQAKDTIQLPSDYDPYLETSWVERQCKFTIEDSKTRIIENGLQYSKDRKRLLKCGNKSTYIVINNTVEIICDNAFEDCSELESVVFPKSLICIGKEAFRNCQKLKFVDLPESTRMIGERAFSCCYELSSINMPKVRRIGGRCFGFTKKLQKITIPKSTTIIEGNPIVCSNVTSIVCQDSSFVVKDGILYSDYGKKIVCCICPKERIEIPEGVTNIGDYAFYRNNNITSIILPDSLCSIGDYAFSGLGNLEEVKMSQYCKVRTIGICAFNSCKKLKAIRLPFSLSVIGGSAFQCCENLVDISLPSSVTEIGGGAFSYCNRLESIYLPTHLRKMGYGVFSSSNKLKAIRLPESIDSNIGRAFDGSQIETIYVPKMFRLMIEKFLMINDRPFTEYHRNAQIIEY